MNPIAKLLNKGKAQLTDEQRNAYMMEGARNEAMTNNETDIAWKQLNGIRYEAIHDEDKESILAEKVLPKTYIPKVNEETGEVEIERDAEGKPRLNGKGEPIIKYVQGFQVDNFYAALLNMNSHVQRLTFLNPKKSRLIALMAEDIIEDVKTNKPEANFDTGEGAYLNAQLSEQFMLLSDCENGNKVKAMLEIRKVTKMDMTMGQPEKQKGIF